MINALMFLILIILLAVKGTDVTNTILAYMGFVVAMELFRIRRQLEKNEKPVEEMM